MKIYTDEQLTKKINKKKSIKRVIKLITYPIFAIILVISIYAFIQRMINPEQVIDIFGYKAFSITSGSMEDTLQVGDLIIVKKPKDEKSIEEGDIITFRLQNYIITHRIVKIEDIEKKKYFITKGDNNSATDDEKVEYENIEGVLIKKIHGLGKSMLIAQNTNVIIIIGIVLYLIYCFWADREDRNIARHKKRKGQEL